MDRSGPSNPTGPSPSSRSGPSNPTGQSTPARSGPSNPTGPSPNSRSGSSNPTGPSPSSRSGPSNPTGPSPNPENELPKPFSVFEDTAKGCSHVNVQKFINKLLHGVFTRNEYLAGRSTTGKDKAKAGPKARPGLNKELLVNIINMQNSLILYIQHC
ncbi:hypothetical protein CAPTEDRAFT_204579 [Capitella teleta]|uniref:BEN domain-containing protein n=1 Tax=Capitella teleta TaxID=283909 RepID=R7TQE0_CAPTE|nr:hypothetical protein CAPTEDRAFT_204579 [Capitella teleta]|eukprot:ELT95777.1 hypothetical protein CAPTEDRAFT_204579 [Capitella teleta]